MKPTIKGQRKFPFLSLFSRIPARQRIIIGTILIAVCTIIAFSVTPKDSAKPPGSITAWLLRPIDPFEQARKPFVKSNLRAIARVPGSQTLIAVGSGGLILRSEDVGTHWEPHLITLTPEEMRRLRETSVPKERERMEEKKSEVKQEKDRSRDAGLISTPRDRTEERKAGLINRYDTTPQVRRVPDLLPVPDPKRLPEAKPNEKKTAK
jgi:hypothetical protein